MARSEGIICHELPTADIEFREAADGSGEATGLVVPWDRPTTVGDFVGDRLIRYTEVFRRGSLDRAIAAPNRIPLAYGHSDSFADRLGRGLEFRDSVEGLVGTFVLDRARMDQAREALTSSHTGLSIAFRSLIPRPGSEREGATVERRSVVPIHVAAVPEGAYAAALLTSVRSDQLPDEELTDADRQAAERAQLDAELLAAIDDLAVAGQRWAALRS